MTGPLHDPYDPDHRGQTPPNLLDTARSLAMTAAATLQATHDSHRRSLAWAQAAGEVARALTSFATTSQFLDDLLNGERTRGRPDLIEEYGLRLTASVGAHEDLAHQKRREADGEPGLRAANDVDQQRTGLQRAMRLYMDVTGYEPPLDLVPVDVGEGPRSFAYEPADDEDARELLNNGLWVSPSPDAASQVLVREHDGRSNGPFVVVHNRVTGTSGTSVYHTAAGARALAARLLAAADLLDADLLDADLLDKEPAGEANSS